MLDLKELEKSLDLALASETYESVLAWFQERDKDRAKSYIGVEGYLNTLSSIHDKNTQSEVQKETLGALEIIVSKNDTLPLAA